MRGYNHYIAFFIVLIALIASAMDARASGLAEEDYKRDAERIFSQQWIGEPPSGVDYLMLRRTYSETPFYDPYAQNAVEVLLDVANEMKATQDTATLKKLSVIYNQILKDQIANFTVVTKAWELAKDSPVFGNYKYWNKLRGRLFSTVIKSGDGTSFVRAYDVITTDEEIYLLKFLGYEVIDTLAYEKGMFKFNIHSVVDKNTGQQKEVYINTTIPVEYIARQKKRETKKFDLNP